MGHISNPISNRLGFTSFWSSFWCSFINKNYSYFLSEDYVIEDFIFWLFFSSKKKFIKEEDFFINRFYIYRTFSKFIIKIKFFSFTGSNRNRSSKEFTFFFKNLYKSFKKVSKDKGYLFLTNHLKLKILLYHIFFFFIRFIKKKNSLNFRFKKNKKNKKIIFFKFCILFFGKLLKRKRILKKINKDLLKKKEKKFSLEIKKSNLSKILKINSRISLKKNFYFNSYNISFYFFNKFFFNLIFKKYLFFGLSLKKVFSIIKLKEKNFFLILQKEDILNIKASSLAFLFKNYMSKNDSIYAFISKFFRFIKKNPFIKSFKIIIKGRFSKSSRSRTKIFNKGSIALNTFKMPIDYGFNKCITKYGVCGIKIFLYKSLSNKSRVKNQNMNNSSIFESFNIFI